MYFAVNIHAHTSYAYNKLQFAIDKAKEMKLDYPAASIHVCKSLGAVLLSSPPVPPPPPVVAFFVEHEE